LANVGIYVSTATTTTTNTTSTDDDDNDNNNNSVQLFIISVLHQQPEGQLQMQHKGKQNNKYNKITTIRL
jgi:hypothetical protein